MEEKNHIEEIMNGVTSEEMSAMYINNGLIEPVCKMYQLNSKGHRYYYTFDENGEPTFYPSVTTILSQTMPRNPFLEKWRAQMGMEEAERYTAEKASYGTFFHAECERLLIAGEYDLDELREHLKKFIEQEQLADNFIYYEDDLKKDILAFAQWVIDYEVKPIAVEISLHHPTLNYAGMIDLPCTMCEKPHSEERINAIVDLKSGKSGFWEDYEIQLHMYKDMWNANFPGCPIERVFNFAPKDWRKKPTYNFKEQTNSANAAKIPALLALAAIEDNKREKVFMTTGGKIDLTAENVEDNYMTMTLSEIIKQRKESKNVENEEKK